MSNDQTNDLLKELIAEIKDLKEINEKSGEKKEKESSAAPKAGYQSTAGITFRQGSRVDALKNYFGMDGPKKAKENRTISGDIKSLTGIVNGLSSLVDFMAPEIKKDIDREFDYTHTNPYKQAEAFLKDAASQGTFYTKGESYDIYKSFQRIGERQKKAVEGLEDSPARREGLVAANVKNMFGWDMDEFILKISRALQSWWNNDASKNIQTWEGAHVLNDERIAQRARKHGGINKVMQTGYGEDQ